ncbi:hypothetical protein ACH4MU_29060 [Streptomyces albidoflavus]
MPQLETIMLLLGLSLAGAAFYGAYRDEKLGPSLMVGAAVLTVFYVLMDRDPVDLSQTVAPSTLPTLAPAQPGQPTPESAQPGQPTPESAQPGQPTPESAQPGLQ